MRFFRYGVQLVAGLLLSIALIAIPFLVVFHVILGSPQALKNSLTASGVYQQVVPAVLDANNPADLQPAARQVLQDQGVRQAIQAALPAQLVQSLVEQIIDQTYDWLYKPTVTPQVFSVDTTPLHTAIAQGLHGYAQQRAGSLPTCTLTQLANLQASQNILTLPCLPPGIDAASAADTFAAAALGSLQIPAELSLNTARLNSDSTLQSTMTIRYLHDAYRLLAAALWPLVGCAILLAALLIAAATDRRRTTARLGRALAIQGGLLALVSIVLAVMADNLTHANGSSISNPALQQAVAVASSHFVRIGALGLLATSGVYILLGAASVAIVWRHYRQRELLEAKEGTV